MLLYTSFSNSFRLLQIDLVRQSAPTDGRDVSGTIVAANKVALTSKQNSDAMGMLYQWGRKDPYMFASCSESYGKYPVKIYTIDGVLIYQESNGSNNKDKQPAGGIVVPLTLAASMMEAVKNPIIFYGYEGTVVSQVGKTKDLWNYYWTSYSRGSDGYGSWNETLINDQKWHNDYLDGYLSKRSKSIFDPCPYGYRVPSNGTYASLIKKPWIHFSFNSGLEFTIQNNTSWLSILGSRDATFRVCGYVKTLSSSTYFTSGYLTVIVASNIIYNSAEYYQRFSQSVRCIDFRQSAPTDGRDPFGNGGFYTSKQNSDASGMFYQWGRKDPFIYATSSEAWGPDNIHKGKYPVKIYTIDGVLIYQEYKGGNNKDKQPEGGVMLSTLANSMMVTIKHPIIFYGGSISSELRVISQVGQTKDLFDYYWISYSRGVDYEGKHNAYLDGYISQRSKSIYDPCPYGFRVHSNFTYDSFITNNSTWVKDSYVNMVYGNLGSAKTAFVAAGQRTGWNLSFESVGAHRRLYTGSVYDNINQYAFLSYGNNFVFFYVGRSYGMPVRCIEFVSIIGFIKHVE